MKFEIEGEVYAVFATKVVSQRFSKREFVITTNDGKYSQTIMFESSGRAIEELDDIADGDKVRVHFNVRGREWRSPSGETKYFNSLSAWKIERLSTQRQASSPRHDAQPPLAPPSGNLPDDDIPF